MATESKTSTAAKAKKLYAAYVKALGLKRTWDGLAPVEQAAWRAVASAA
jgi:hypothetical protein